MKIEAQQYIFAKRTNYINPQQPSFKGDLMLDGPELEHFSESISRGAKNLGKLIKSEWEDLFAYPSKTKAQMEYEEALEKANALIAKIKKEKEEEDLKLKKIERDRQAKIYAKQRRKEKVKDFFYDIGDFIGDAAYTVKEKFADMFNSIRIWYKWTAKDKIIDFKDNVVEKTVDSAYFVKDKTLQGIYGIKNWYINTGKEKIANAAESIEETSTIIVDFVSTKSKNGFNFVKTKSVEAKNAVIEKIAIKTEERDMMDDLKNFFRKGGANYLPQRPLDPFNPENLKEITPKTDYSSTKEEVQRLCNLYIQNTAIVDTSAVGFNALSKNFFSSAAAGLKEIFDLGSDVKILERIPKIGVVPKTLRISQQMALIKCIQKDYKEVTDWYVKNGVVSIVDKYNKQYETIKDFIESSSSLNKADKQYARACLAKIKEAKDKRGALYAKMLSNYAKAGSNLNKICNTKNTKNAFELARKVAITIGSFV